MIEIRGCEGLEDPSLRLDVTLIPELLASRAGLGCTRGSNALGSIVRISESLAILPAFVIPITVFQILPDSER